MKPSARKLLTLPTSTSEFLDAARPVGDGHVCPVGKSHTVLSGPIYRWDNRLWCLYANRPVEVVWFEPPSRTCGLYVEKV